MKALVVDDDASIRKILVKVLIEGGFDVVGEAADGEQALEIAARLLPDVITLDDSMPRMGGFEALPQLRKALPDAVIVMLTMHMQYEEHARRGGADAYVLKLSAVDELIPAIRSA
jgi:DNA-binding NarL/FixJ family response regulator